MLATQSALDPHSGAAHDITTLWWGMLAAATVVFAGVLVLIALSIVQRRREGAPVVGNDENKMTGLIVAFGIVIPVVTLSALFFIADIGVVKATDAPAKGQTQMTIDVTARDWFWQVSYPGSRAVTANEIHIPARTNVEVRLTSSDVIHSFWVPQLNKKVDAVPGHPNTLALYADQPGVYRGQCAEFCGLQHANMAMAVYADPPAKFKQWLARESRPVADRSGLGTFTRDQCASCHSLRGTAARGEIGPDLTHVGSRATLGALVIPNDPAHMAQWIRNPERFKPGSKMPKLPLSASDVQQLARYLEGLK